MEEQTFGEQIITPFSQDRIQQDDNEHEAIISDLEPRASTTDDVLFSSLPVESIAEPDEVSEETTILLDTPLGTTIPDSAPVGNNDESLAALFSQNESAHFRTRWNEIQGMFVDEPHTAVQKADDLLSNVIEMLSRNLSKEHNTLEVQWKQGNDVSTENLRQVLQHYRTFFNRLVV